MTSQQIQSTLSTCIVLQSKIELHIHRIALTPHLLFSIFHSVNTIIHSTFNNYLLKINLIFIIYESISRNKLFIFKML